MKSTRKKKGANRKQKQRNGLTNEANIRP